MCVCRASHMHNEYVHIESLLPPHNHTHSSRRDELWLPINNISYLSLSSNIRATNNIAHKNRCTEHFLFIGTVLFCRYCLCPFVRFVICSTSREFLAWQSKTNSVRHVRGLRVTSPHQSTAKAYICIPFQQGGS